MNLWNSNFTWTPCTPIFSISVVKTPGEREEEDGNLQLAFTQRSFICAEKEKSFVESMLMECKEC